MDNEYGVGISGEEFDDLTRAERIRSDDGIYDDNITGVEELDVDELVNSTPLLDIILKDKFPELDQIVRDRFMAMIGKCAEEAKSELLADLNNKTVKRG